MAEAYSLFQVNEFLKRSVALNFPNPIWVQAEIAQIRESRGHWYIELVEKDQKRDEIIAQSSAVIWRNNFAQLLHKIGPELKGILTDGMEVMLKCQVTFHERYGLKFTISDVQPEFTIGRLAKEREATIAKLKANNLLKLNRALPAPLVIQNIAVISSTTAAGYQDFFQQLVKNNLGYQFKVELFPAAMQGLNTEPEVLKQLINIQRKNSFDAVVIIRGGGAKLDLVAFDSYNISEAVAKLNIPVFVGIGHDIDESVVDLVAYKSLKTPTAVAEYIIAVNQVFEEGLLGFYDDIKEVAQFVLQHEKDKLLRAEEYVRLRIPAMLVKTRMSLASHQEFLKFHLPQKLAIQKNHIEYLSKGIIPSFNGKINVLRSELESIEKQVKLLSPESTLERGYTISLLKGKSLGKTNLPEIGQDLVTLSRIGKVNSKIEKYEQSEK